MASYQAWTLPLNPPNPYGVYLHSLAPIRAKDQQIYYTKYILGVIGELTPRKAAVREWTYPSQLFTQSMASAANLTHFERDPQSDDLWCLAQDYHGALVKFSAATGVFTRYMTNAPGTPLISPANLKFDAMGCVWVAGTEAKSNLSTISRFEPGAGKMTSWTVPITAMLNLVSIHPNSAGTKVWVSSVDSNAGSTRQWIGCLDVATNVLSCYSPTPYPDSPRVISIVLSEGSPEFVWFTAANVGIPAIYKMDTASETFNKYDTDPASWPRYITLDAARNAWVTDIARNSVFHCGPRACSTVRFKKCNFTLNVSKQSLKKASREAKVVVSPAPVTTDTVAVTKHACTDEEIVASLQMPDQLQYQILSKGSSLYLVNWGDNRIGLLIP